MIEYIKRLYAELKPNSFEERKLAAQCHVKLRCAKSADNVATCSSDFPICREAKSYGINLSTARGIYILDVQRKAGDQIDPAENCFSCNAMITGFPVKRYGQPGSS